MNPSHPNFIEFLSDNYNTVKVSFDLTQIGFIDTVASARAMRNSVPSAVPANPRAPWQDAPLPAPGSHAVAPAATYTYKVPKEWTLKEGDLVVVPGSSWNEKPKLAIVVSVDPLPDINFEAGIAYKWIIDVVAMGAYTERLQKEQEFRDAMVRVERERQRQKLASELREQFLDSSGAGRMFAEALKMINASVPAAPVQDPPAPQ